MGGLFEKRVISLQRKQLIFIIFFISILLLIALFQLTIQIVSIYKKIPIFSLRIVSSSFSEVWLNIFSFSIIIFFILLLIFFLIKMISILKSKMIIRNYWMILLTSFLVIIFYIGVPNTIAINFSIPVAMIFIIGISPIIIS